MAGSSSWIAYPTLPLHCLGCSGASVVGIATRAALGPLTLQPPDSHLGPLLHPLMVPLAPLLRRQLAHPWILLCELLVEETVEEVKTPTVLWVQVLLQHPSARA